MIWESFVIPVSLRCETKLYTIIREWIKGQYRGQWKSRTDRQAGFVRIGIRTETDLQLTNTSSLPVHWGFPGGTHGKEPSYQCRRYKETQVRSLSQEDSLQKEMPTQSMILAWRIPWTEEPGGLQSMGSQRVRHDWATNTFTFFFQS